MAIQDTSSLLIREKILITAFRSQLFSLSIGINQSASL